MIYVDGIIDYKGIMKIETGAKCWGTKWCHMATDEDNFENLHRLAEKIGLKRKYFQWKNKTMPHYDLIKSKRELAIQNGAIPVTSTELVRRCSSIFKNKTSTKIF